MSSFSINQDFKDLLTKDGDELCDATLVSSNDGSSISVHKLVLATRSQYFKTAFFGEFSSGDTAKLHFEKDVLEAIKKYCYTDSVGDKIIGDYRYKKADAAKAGLRKDCGFLVRLAVAADYLILPGLQRLVWKAAYDKLRYGCSEQRHLLIPTIYSEAKSMGAEELKVLAWHAYWIYQQKAENSSWMEKIEMDTPLLFEDPLLPRDINYKELGVILILGCSEDDVNGEYYGVGKFPCKHSAFTYALYKKDKDKAESLSIIQTSDEDEEDFDDSHDHCELQFIREEDCEDGGKSFVYPSR